MPPSAWGEAGRAAPAVGLRPPAAQLRVGQGSQQPVTIYYFRAALGLLR